MSDCYVGRLVLVKGYLPFTREIRKFQLENQMIHAIPFGKLQKTWAVIWGDTIFLLFKVSLADVDIFYSDTHSRNFAFNCFMLMPEISNRMVFVNGKLPKSLLLTPNVPCDISKSYKKISKCFYFETAPLSETDALKVDKKIKANCIKI